MPALHLDCLAYEACRNVALQVFASPKRNGTYYTIRDIREYRANPMEILENVALEAV